jgi:hypothetical protein
MVGIPATFFVIVFCLVGIPDRNQRSLHVSAECVSDQFCICGLNHGQFFMYL